MTAATQSGVETFAPRLLRWFDVSGRHDLPWQHPRTPYRVWLSEIMLQQTQVKTVIPYFERFVEALPTLPALASASRDDVMALWSGLGYYARARNLQAAAQRCVELHGGELPRDIDALTALPGVGRSTAAAILSQAWGDRHAILDGNVKRVLTRYHGIEGYPGLPAVEKRLWSLAEAHLPATRMADYTQAQMDLGATLCTRSDPACVLCPLQDDCMARVEGRTADLPTPKPSKTAPQKARLRAVAAQYRRRSADAAPPRNGHLGVAVDIAAGRRCGFVARVVRATAVRRLHYSRATARHRSRVQSLQAAPAAATPARRRIARSRQRQ
jgi:A/G-specific adenine glycosylase